MQIIRAKLGGLSRPFTLALCLGMTLPGVATAQGSETLRKAGDILQIALPALAGICAIRQDRAQDFFLGLALNEVGVQGLKYGLGNSAINRRPNGSSHGFPSGHTASATFGATNLAKKCFPDKPVLGALAYGTALAVWVSRVNAGRHTTGQVLAGALIGYATNGFSFAAGSGGVGIGFRMDF